MFLSWARELLSIVTGYSNEYFMAFDSYFSIASCRENNMLTKRQWSVTEVLTRIKGYTQEKINYFGERRKDFTKGTSLELNLKGWVDIQRAVLERGWHGKVEARRMKTSGILHEKIQNNQRKKAIETEIETETHTYIIMYVYTYVCIFTQYKINTFIYICDICVIHHMCMCV